MKKIVCILSMLAALGLASCGGAPESSSSSQSTGPTTNPSSSSSTRPSSSSTPAPSSSSSTPSTPVEPTRPATYAGFAYWAYEGSTRGADFHEDVKWEKGATWTWTFTANKAVENAWLTVGAKMTSSSHASRTLFTDSNGADSSDAFESNPENDGTPRLSVNLNGEDKALTNTKTYGDVLSTDEYRDLDLVHPVSIKEGKNVLKIGTNANVGYRLYLGEQVRFFYEGTGLELTLGAPAESTDTTPVESSEEPPVESSEEPPVESSEEPPVESSEEPPVESSEPPVESSEEPPAPHVHEYGNPVTRYNSEGKEVTMKSCADDDAKEISIAYNDGKTLGGKLALETKMEKGAHTEWHINVDKAITGAKIYFEGTAGTNNGRYFFNQNKEVNPVNPVTGEEFPDDDAGTNADKATEDQWRYMVSVGEGEKIAPKQGGTFTDAGAGVGPMYFADIDLAAGDNVVKLWQMNIGFRLTFSGNVYIRYEGDAVINGLQHKDSADIVIGEDVVPLKINAEAGSKEWMATKVELDPAKPFAIHVWENDNEVWLHASELKDGVTAAADSGNENHDIAVAEAGLYDIYVGVADLSETNKYKCIWIAKNTAAAPITFAWDTAIQDGSSGLDGTKFNKNATYTFKVTAEVAGTVTLSWTMMGSDGNGAKTINGSGQDFTVKAGAADDLKDGTVIPAGKTYTEVFGADQKAWVVVDFLSFDLVAGDNLIQVKTGNGGYRINVDKTKDIVLTY